MFEVAEMIVRMHEAEGLSLMDVWRHCMKNKLLERQDKPTPDYTMISHFYRRYSQFREKQATRRNDTSQG